MKPRMILILCLVVILAFLVPLGDGKRGPSAQTGWLLSGSAASFDDELQISNLTWKVQGISLGGDYRLENVSMRSSTGNGCCCSFLPCVFSRR
jgi:hypothetical protein